MARTPPHHARRRAHARRRDHRHRGARGERIFVQALGADGRDARTLGRRRHHTKAANLRVALNDLLGEHMDLAAAASQAGYSATRTSTALAKALDQNSVETANAIGSVYGAAARNKFLNGRALWRDHIRFFVNYTVALAKKDKAGQTKAVNNLKGYIEAFSSFLATATGLPKSALPRRSPRHVGHLKAQIDAYAKGNYTRSATQTRHRLRAHGHDRRRAGGAIVKKFPNKFR